MNDRERLRHVLMRADLPPVRFRVGSDTVDRPGFHVQAALNPAHVAEVRWHCSRACNDACVERGLDLVAAAFAAGGIAFTRSAGFVRVP